MQASPSPGPSASRIAEQLALRAHLDLKGFSLQKSLRETRRVPGLPWQQIERLVGTFLAMFERREADGLFLAGGDFATGEPNALLREAGNPARERLRESIA